MVIKRPNLWFHKENVKVPLAKPDSWSNSVTFYLFLYQIPTIQRDNKAKLSMIEEIHRNKSHENIIQLWFCVKFRWKRAPIFGEENYDSQIIKVIIE